MGDRLATIDMGRKERSCCAPFGELGPRVAGAEAYTSVPSFILIHPTVWPQYTNVTDRQTGQRSDSIGRIVLQTVAQKPHDQTSRSFLYVLTVAVHGSFILRRHYNISCISGSGFVNDVIFAHNRPSKGDANRMYTQTDSQGGRTARGEV